MNKLVWKEQLNIGVDVIDTAHANLFRIVGKLMDRIENDSNYESACREGIKYLEDYTMKHFSEEEAYMRSIHFRGYEKHKKLHDTFREQTLVALKKTLKSSQYSRQASSRFLAILLGWLTGHIMTEDQEITGASTSQKLHNQSSNSDTAAQIVKQAMEDIFHIGAELVDADYNGRNMGMTLHCRLCYDVDGGGKVQILLGVEDRLIRRGVGLILGLAAMRDTAMVQQVSLQIFEQFLHHMGKLYESDTTYALRKEELLTSDEFRSDFMTRYPCSLLFDTRLGHFLFCSRKWMPKKRKAESSANV